MYRYYYDADGVITQRITVPTDDRFDYFADVAGDYIVSDQKVNPDKYRVDLSTLELIEIAVPTPAVDLSFEQQRQVAYGSMGLQLAMLYDDIQAGVFGEEAKHGTWAQHIAGAKAAVPKT